ncbi:RNA polymerase sigma-24 factor [Gluconacetobacter liquefaciens NRIC 0522]|uniref:RNA polymerase sigma-70 factor (ECF subfamily) n=1 Tax=Gluconacetobacter liquefaciens TaxID=89584 RepID=A0A370GCH1_GLULI|nr:sigma-70 family RNA polymerase sigma factor [Gluconacetobacter liquefaciens]MBB2185329.1 sigma-70 family RNA polymerase sigma factor [Gluconacetobacter liquefaciens]RDI40769.1 RNA polymerase sigma-70 factor (ECF subfamily) [Gluconacetobacter liquefaciens]GBR00584.1 RNA polymerase sigma-24 factor [Gluconacetobacter liquefaciens NRIC 0522]
MAGRLADWMACVGSEKDNLDLFMTHRQRLVDYATTMLGSAAQSEDVVQEAWIRFSGAADPGALREPLRYLFRIVRNIVVDGHRAQVSRGRYLVAASTPETTLSRPDDRPAPEAEILHRQQLAIVQEALAELPQRTRRAVELHRLEGLKTREVAERLGISVTRTHTLIAEGVAHCRRRLKSPG